MITHKNNNNKFKIIIKINKKMIILFKKIKINKKMTILLKKMEWLLLKVIQNIIIKLKKVKNKI